MFVCVCVCVKSCINLQLDNDSFWLVSEKQISDIPSFYWLKSLNESLPIFIDDKMIKLEFWMIKR